MPGPGAGLLRVFVFSLHPNVACVGRSGLGPEAAPRLAPGSAGSSNRFPQRAAPRRREGQKRRDEQIRPQLSATERQRESRAGGPQPAVGRGVCFCLPAPDRGPSPWQPQRARLRAPASGSTRGSGPCAGGTEGEVKDGEEGRNLHLRQVWIWGGESKGEPWNKEKEPLRPPWGTSFPVSLSGRKHSLSSPNRWFSAYSLIYLQLINTSLIILPRPVHSLSPSNEASHELLLAAFSDYILPPQGEEGLGNVFLTGEEVR